MNSKNSFFLNRRDAGLEEQGLIKLGGSFFDQRSVKVGWRMCGLAWSLVKVIAEDLC